MTTFTEVKHRHENPVACVVCARIKSQFYLLQFVNKKHPLTCLLAKHQNTANFALQTYEKKWWTGTAWALTLAPEIFLIT